MPIRQHQLCPIRSTFGITCAPHQFLFPDFSDCYIDDHLYYNRIPVHLADILSRIVPQEPRKSRNVLDLFSN